MMLRIVKVKDAGVLKKERVILEVTRDTDVGRYLLCDTTFDEKGKISNLLRHTFWFPDKLVKKGDYVAVYSAVGEDTEFQNTGKSTTHVFYWGLDVTVWNKSGDGAILFRAGDWEAKNLLPKEE